MKLNQWICPPDCPDRKATADYNCHSHCERYLKFKIKSILRQRKGLRIIQEKDAVYEARRKIRKAALKNARDKRERGNGYK